MSLALPAGLGRREGIALAVTTLAAISLALFSWKIPVFAQLERVAYDLRLAATAPQVGQDERIVLLVVDEATVAETRRRSPIDRYLLARAVDALNDAKPKAVIIDILFDQPAAADEDAALVAALRRAKYPIRLASAIGEEEEVLASWQVDTLRDFFAAVRSPEVKPASAALYADADRVVRRTAPDASGTLADDAARLAGGSPAPSDMPVEFREPAASDVPVFARIPIHSLANADPQFRSSLAPLLQGKIILIGADLPGSDRHRIPLSIASGDEMAGIEVHAQILANLLDQRLSEPVSGPVMWLWAVLSALLGILAGWLRVGTSVRIVIVISMIGSLLVFSLWAERPMGVQTYGLPVVGSLLAWLLTSFIAGAISRRATIEERRISREIVGRYLPKDVAAAIERQPSLLDVHGSRRSLAILFTDLAGFTHVSENLEPERLSAILNAYLEGMASIVLANGGTLDKFIGDAVVAFWGAPLEDPDAAARALTAALAMERFALDFAAETKEKGVALGATRMGLHFGDAIVGNFGGKSRVQYTAIGDAVNLASRLEAANKSLGTLILASDAIVSRAHGVPVRCLGDIAVVGRSAPVRVFEVSTLITEDVALAHAELFKGLCAGDPARIAELAEQSAASPEDRGLAFLLRRSETVGWTGVYRLETK